MSAVEDYASSSSKVHNQSASSTTTSTQSRKRKAASDNTPIPSSANVIDLTATTPPKKRKKAATSKEEKRARKWRSHPPGTYYTIRDRALSQRMFVLDRQRSTSDPEVPSETVSIAGTTGNVYSVTINQHPSCNCPHALKGNQCKHIVYVLARVLRVPFELEYQLAFLSSELKDIFTRAPPLPSELADGSKKDGNRKPLQGECPICCEDFDTKDSGEDVVYCAASCGNNVHKACFEQWAATKGGGEVPCPFCRSPWQGDSVGTNLKKLAESGRMTADGYVNVAGQLGISGKRDYSTYHPQWVRRQFGYD